MLSITFLSLSQLIYKNFTITEYCPSFSSDSKFFALRFSIVDGLRFAELTDNITLINCEELMASNKLVYENGYQKFLCFREKDSIFETSFYQKIREMDEKESRLLKLYMKMYILYKDESAARKDIEALFKAETSENKLAKSFLKMAFTIRKHSERPEDDYFEYFKYIIMCYCNEVFTQDGREMSWDERELINTVEIEDLTKFNGAIYDALVTCDEYLSESFVFINENGYLRELVFFENNKTVF